MSVPRIVFFKDAFYSQLQPYYEAAATRGDIIFGGTLAIEDSHIICHDAEGKKQEQITCDYVATSAYRRYLSYKKTLYACGISDEHIINGCAFAVPGIDLPRFFADGSIWGKLDEGVQIEYKTHFYFPTLQHLVNSFFSLQLGRLSYIGSCQMEGRGYLTIGDFSSISWNQTFELGLNNCHHIDRISTRDWMDDADWPEFRQEPLPRGCITIGSDVWIGRGCHLKASGRPLTIGDGAVIASDSNVVKDVPPYAIVGGNPAKFIRWRFPEPIREALQTIRRWDWPLEKIHAARLEMKAPAAFVKKYLPEAK